MMTFNKTLETMKTDLKSKEIAGGSPSSGGRADKSKQKDESTKGSKKVMDEATSKSEKGNMTGNKGYNETPASVPVKSTKEK